SGGQRRRCAPRSALVALHAAPARTPRARRRQELEDAEHEEAEGDEGTDENERLLAQHGTSMGARSATDRYTARTIARSSRPEAASISPALPRAIASRTAVNIASYPRVSRRYQRTLGRPPPLTMTNRPRLSAKQLARAPVTVDH